MRAGTAAPRVVRDALFAQAGLHAVDGLSEVSGLLAVLCWHPLPAGRRVAVLTNAGGAGVLGADALSARLDDPGADAEPSDRARHAPAAAFDDVGGGRPTRC